VSWLLLSTLGGYKRFTLGGRDTLRKVGPHDTEGVRCSLARFIGYVWEYTRGYSTQLYSVKSTKIIMFYDANIYPKNEYEYVRYVTIMSMLWG